MWTSSRRCAHRSSTQFHLFCADAMETFLLSIKSRFWNLAGIILKRARTRLSYKLEPAMRPIPAVQGVAGREHGNLCRKN